jgi:hypothetical protein
VAARSKAWVCGRSFFEIAGSHPAGAGMSPSYECSVLSGADLCDRPVTRPEESYRVGYVGVRPQNLANEESLAH